MKPCAVPRKSLVGPSLDVLIRHQLFADGARNALIEFSQRTPQHQALKFGNDPKKLSSFKDLALTEMELSSALHQMASVEAMLVNRVMHLSATSALNPAAAQFYARIPQTKKMQLAAESAIAILQLQISNPQIKNALSQYAGWLQLRHWIAHGRSFQLNMPFQRYQGPEVTVLCTQLAMTFGT